MKIEITPLNLNITLVSSKFKQFQGVSTKFNEFQVVSSEIQSKFKFKRVAPMPLLKKSGERGWKWVEFVNIHKKEILSQKKFKEK